MEKTIQEIHQRVNQLIENNQEYKISREKYRKVMGEIKKAIMEDLNHIWYFDLEKKIYITKNTKDNEEWIFTTMPEKAGYQDIVQHGEIIKKNKETRILMKAGEVDINIVGSELQKKMSEDKDYDGVTNIILKKDRCYLDHSKRGGRDDHCYITIATQEELTKILQGLDEII